MTTKTQAAIAAAKQWLDDRERAGAPPKTPLYPFCLGSAMVTYADLRLVVRAAKRKAAK